MALSAANPIPHWHWPQENEVNLLNAILEIANEPVESYDPGINLFDRINKNMDKSLTDREILDKIKQLKKRFRISCLKLKFGIFHVKRSRVFQISKKIWGKKREMKEMDAKSSKVNPEEGSRPNHKREREPRKKRDGVESKQPARKKQKKHIARDCSGKKIAKQLTEQEHSEDISKGSVVLQLEAENKCKELSGGSVFVSSLVNPQEASRPNCSPGGSRPNCPQEASGPNCEQEHVLTKKQNDEEPNYDQQYAEQNVKEKLCHSCRKSGHIARDCITKKIAKQPTKNQHTEDVSNGSVMLQSRTENKCEELSGGSVFVSSGANPQEAFRPNCEREHELTMGQNNAEHNYEPQPAKQKIAKKLTKQQETKDISKGPVVLQFGEDSMCEELSGGSVFVSSKVNPPEASRPNCEREHELTTKCDDAELNYEQQPAEQKVKERFCYVCSKFGHTSRDCFDKIAKQMIKSQDGKDVSKGSVELQFEAQNKCKELFGESAVASFQTVSLQPRSEQTWQRDEVPSYSLHVAQEYFWKQRMEVYYRSQPDANQHASCQGMQAFLHRSQQMNPYNGFQPASHHYPSDQWMRESVTPPITPQPPNFGPPSPIPLQPPNGGRSLIPQQPPNSGPSLVPPQPPNWGPPLIPPQPPNSGPSLVPPQPPNWGPPLIPPQPPNWGPQPANCGFQPIPQQPANWGPPPIPPQPSNGGVPSIPQQTANWGPPPIPSQPSNGGVLSIPQQPANWGQPPIPSQPPNCGPSSIYGLPPVPPQPPNGRSPPVPPQHPNQGPPPIPLQFSNWGPPPVTPQPPNWSPPRIPPPPPNWSPPPIPPPPPPNCGLSPVSPQPPNCGPPPVPPQPPNPGLPNPITTPYSYPPPLIPYQYPYN